MSSYLVSAYTWAIAHPELCLAAFMATVTFFAKPRTPEQYAALPPRLAAFLKMWAALGPDVLKAAKAAQEMKAGKNEDPK